MLRSRQLVLVVVGVGVLLIGKEALPLWGYTPSHAAPAAQHPKEIAAGRLPTQPQHVSAFRPPAVAETTATVKASGGSHVAAQAVETAPSRPSEKAPARPLEKAPARPALVEAATGKVSALTPAQPAALPAQPTNVSIAPAAVSATGATSSTFIALGIVSNVMWQNSFDRRKWIRQTFMTYPNVGQSMPTTFVIGMLQTDLSRIPQHIENGLVSEQEQFHDLLLLQTVPERKSPCLKTMAWYKWAVRAYPTATFIAKTDDDAYVHTLKLEHNMRRFASNPLVYIGSTLWGSYIPTIFEACARRMGPMMTMGGMKEEKCLERGAIGPYPYAVGMLQVLSYQVASWMVNQSEFAEFERRATAATKPPMMDHGEDMVIGMFLYNSPWPLMPLHWGWDKLHDLCFKCERKDQIWRPITHQTVVAHHVANEIIMTQVHKNITRVCDDACVQTDLPFEVESLEDLCSRGVISRVYSKCKMVERRRPQ